MQLYVPEEYKPKLDLRETEVAIKKLKDYFETALAYELYLTRVSAPLFVKPDTGLNDNLNGVSSDISNNHKDIKSKYEELLRQNNKLVEMINEINAKDKQFNIETLKNKIDAIINIHNVKPTKKKEVGKLTRDILICSYKELPNEPSVDEVIKIEKLINEQILDIKKNNPKWFKEQEIESDNEIIKRLCNENSGSKVYRRSF